MQLFDYLSEKAITAAMQRGEFDHLPGAGRPLTLEDDAMVPEELRMAYRILKNSGFVPPEVTLRNEIGSLITEIITCHHSDNEKALRKLRCLYTRLAEHGSTPLNLAVHDAYYEKMLSQLAGAEA